jgi:hypothetical protein
MAKRAPQERWSLVEKLGGGQGIAAILGAIAVLLGAVLSQWNRQPPATPAATAAATPETPAAATDTEESLQQTSVADEQPATASEPIPAPAATPRAGASAAPSKVASPKPAHRAQAAATNAPPPTHALPPNAAFPHRGLVRFETRAPHIYMVAEPSSGSVRVASLGPGDVFYVGRTQHGYYAVSTADGLTGWLPVELVTVVHGDAH